MIAAEMLMEDGRLSYRGVGTKHQGQQVKARLVGKHDGPVLLRSLLTRASSSLSSARWPPRRANRPGGRAFCNESPEALSSRLTYAGGIRPRTPCESARLPARTSIHSSKTPRFGSLRQKLGRPGAFFLAQTGCRSGRRLVLEAFHSLLTSTLHPLADDPACATSPKERS